MITETCVNSGLLLDEIVQSCWAVEALLADCLDQRIVGRLILSINLFVKPAFESASSWIFLTFSCWTSSSQPCRFAWCGWCCWCCSCCSTTTGLITCSISESTCSWRFSRSICCKSWIFNDFCLNKWWCCFVSRCLPTWCNVFGSFSHHEHFQNPIRSNSFLTWTLCLSSRLWQTTRWAPVKHLGVRLAEISPAGLLHFVVRLDESLDEPLWAFVRLEAARAVPQICVQAVLATIIPTSLERRSKEIADSVANG